MIVGTIDQSFPKLIMGVYPEAGLVPGLIVFASRPPSVAVPTCRALTCRKNSYGLVLVYVVAQFLSPWRIDAHETVRRYQMILDVAACSRFIKLA